MERWVVFLGLILAAPLLPVALGHGQVQVQPQEVFVVEGRVAWMSAQKMLVAPPNDFAINVDLARISQGDVRLITQGDYVIVTGQLLRPTRTLLALSIRVISPWYPQAP
jgi:hypothetical protein